MADLSGKQAAFVEYYCQTRSGAEAARRAGYSENSIYSIASENLRKPKIQAAIAERDAAIQMQTDEVLTRLSEMARASIEPFLTFIKRKDEDSDAEHFYPIVDLKKAQRLGMLHLVKKLTYDRRGMPQIEFHDSQAALEKIARIHGMFKPDRLALELSPQAQVLIEQLGIKPDEVVEEFMAILQEQAVAEGEG